MFFSFFIFIVGSWYESDSRVLVNQLNNWIVSANKSDTEKDTILKAIVAPHAGYRYSGPVAAYAYGLINPDLYRF